MHQPVPAHILQHDEQTAAHHVPEVAKVGVVFQAPRLRAARDLHELVHQVQQALGPDEVPGHGDLGQPLALKAFLHVDQQPALGYEDSKAPNGKEELHEVDLAGASPEGEADGAADHVRVEEGQGLVHVRRLHQGAEECRVDDVGHVADSDVHVAPGPATVPVQQLVPFRVGELHLVVPPRSVVLVEGVEVVALVQHLPDPVREVLGREAHARRQGVPAHALALRLGRAGVDERHGRARRLAKEFRHVALLEVGSQTMAADALLRGLADVLQEPGNAVRVVVDEGPQRGRRRRRRRGKLRLGHPAEGDAHLERRGQLRLPLPALLLHLLLQQRDQLAGPRLEGQVQRRLPVQVLLDGRLLLQQALDHLQPASVALGKDCRVKHVVVRPLVPRDPRVQPRTPAQQQLHHLQVAPAGRQVDGFAAALLLVALEEGLVGEADVQGLRIVLQKPQHLVRIVAQRRLVQLMALAEPAIPAEDARRARRRLPRGEPLVGARGALDVAVRRAPAAEQRPGELGEPLRQRGLRTFINLSHAGGWKYNFVPG
mmetsp:Transcript_29735/g.85133  ORF Transcript_29735/g.85133 Transcript_29735/m.85133 type:complete len:543 (-) Transcript_29735:33-1661(-)